jgi:serine/threonine protein kinase
MTTSDRLCPLCDELIAEEICPTHHVPTIGPLAPGQEAPRLEPGTEIAGRYRLDSMLGQGGMGLIFQATHLATKEIVVLKLLKDESLSQRTYLRRFYQEARAIARLSHPNIVRIIEFGFDAAARVPFLVMERVEGNTLRELVCAEGPLSVERGSGVMLQVARALREAHDKGVLHRDLKPDNIMVSPIPEEIEAVKVLDFGLAKLLEGDPSMPPLTVPGRIVGTPSYMAPEQVVHATQDFRTDLYGLGCVFHAVLVGRAPFFGNDRLEVMRRKVREPPPPLPSKLRSGEAPSDSLRALHRALLATHRLDRPSSTEEVVDALAAIFEEARRRKPSASPTAIAKSETVVVDPKADARATIPDFDTMPAVPIAEDAGAETMIARIGIEEGLSSEEMVSNEELKTLRAALALDGDVLSIVERGSAGVLTEPKVSAQEQAETLVHPVETRAMRDAIAGHLEDAGGRPKTRDPALGEAEDEAEEAWTSVLPSSLEDDPQETPTPRFEAAGKPRASVRSGATGAPRARPERAHVRADTPYGMQAGIALAALSALAGAVLAILVLKISPLAPPVAPERPPMVSPVAAQPSAESTPASRTVSIESVPESAEVYDGQALLGTTPLNFLLPLKGQEKILRIEKRGFEEASVAVDASTSPRLLVELKTSGSKAPAKKKPKRADAKVPVW